MHRTRLLAILVAASATAALPAAATAAPKADRPAQPSFSLDIGTSEAVHATPPNGIIAVLIGLVQAPPPTVFSGDAYVNEMG